jgi:hypothetical protein
MLKEESISQFIASHTVNGLRNYRRKFVGIILHKIMQGAHSFKPRFQGTYKLYVRKFQERQPNLYSDTTQDRLTLSKIAHVNQGFDLHSVMI